MLRVKKDKMKDLEKYGFTLRNDIYSKMCNVTDSQTIIVSAHMADGYIFVASFFGYEEETLTEIPNVFMTLIADGLVEVDGNEI